MNYYALQVKTGDEESFIKRAFIGLHTRDADSPRLLFPRRMLPIRRKGIIRQELSAVFPGYLFLETECMNPGLCWHIRSVPGFFRFLPEMKHIKALEGSDLATLRHFISLGDVAGESKVSFDEHNRIQILDGPLKGLEGRIVKVDKRKRRAKVKLDLYDESFLIDLAFEILDKR